MSHNTFGHLFRVTTWGESHGPAIGCVVDGCPPRLKLSEADLQPWLDRRRPGQSKFTTQRQEPDQVRILSGVFDGVTTGTPIALTIDRERWDGPAVDENPFFCPDPVAAAEWETMLTSVRKSGSSVGAVIEVIAEGVPPGLGAPIYGKLDAELAAALMSINAVKGVEIGEGFASASLSGEANADEMRMHDGLVSFESNHAGGILGGISTGQPVVARFAVKPTSSILTPRQTVDRAGHDIEITTKGRHDP